MAIVPRLIIPLLLVVLVALSGCDDGAKGAAASSEGADDAASPEASATPNEDEPTEQDAPEQDAPEDDGSASTQESVTTEQFCDGIHPVLVARDGEERGRAAMELLSDGLPDEMSADARQGLQVLVDLSPYFGDTKELFRSYYALASEDKDDVHALAGFVMTACGADLVADLMPSLPDDLLSDLPSDLPSELASLLPS